MRCILPVILSLCAAPQLAAQTETRDVMVVLDMSGSMWGQVDGVAKVEIARDAFGGLLDDWTANGTRAGLIAYGHRERGNCTDIETLATPADGADIAALVAGLTPLGKTPLSDAVRQAAEVLRFTEEAATVVLLSDGVENCSADPCAVGAELEALGLDFTAHVIGFDITDSDKAQLQCLANATGGQYFDASNAGELSDAMDDVVQATAEPVEPVVEEIITQDLTIRIRIDGTLRLPEIFTIYSDDTELGTLTDKTATVPGLPVSLPIGPVTLRVEGEGVSGELMADVQDDTRLLVIDAMGEPANYVMWRHGQFPVQMPGEGALDNVLYVMINNTTGVDRRSHYNTFLVPAGSTDESLRIRGGNIAPYANQFNLTSITSPTEPGDYDFIMMATNGTEYGRIPVTFANDITPEWLGPREVQPDEVFDAVWAGPSNYNNGFQFLPVDYEGDANFTRRTSPQGMATPEGFKLTAPSEAGLYRLAFITNVVNMREFDTVDMGLIAVGVPLPVSAPQAETEDEAALDPMALEIDAMGGEEGPLTPIGDLHGDWVLVAADHRFRPLLETQLMHEQDGATATGGILVRATDWNLGETTGHETFDITRDAETLSFVANLSDRTYGGNLTRDGDHWFGTMDYNGSTVETLNVVLVRPENIPDLFIRANPEPTQGSFTVRDERGETLKTPTNWSIIQGDAQDGEYVQTDGGQYYVEALQPDRYYVTASTDGMSGAARFIHATSWARAHLLVVRPQGEGAELPIATAFYCSPDENCAMEMAGFSLTFRLPLGWGAEQPAQNVSGQPVFNMATMTPDGPFMASLNQRPVDAPIGPCTELVTGTFCHDATDDPALLADLAVIQRSLSFKSVGLWLNEERFDTLLNQLTGESE